MFRQVKKINGEGESRLSRGGFLALFRALKESRRYDELLVAG
jgi:hypothetical protein